MKNSYTTIDRYNLTQNFIDNNIKHKIIEKFKCKTNNDCESSYVCNLNNECQYDVRDSNYRRNKM